MLFVACFLLSQAPILHLSDGAVTQDQPLYHEALRPQFHVTARYWNAKRINPAQHQEGWINDLNGLIYYEGEYHLFAQRWATCWLHFISTDLIHWTELQPAFFEESPGSGVQSGTCVIDYKNTSGLGSDAKHPPMIAFWSRFDNRSQCLHFSLDRGRTWRPYSKNPFMVRPERDPKVFWYQPGKHWVMVMYGEGAYHILNSTNLLDWRDTGHPIPNSFECPDMFELPLNGDPKLKKWVVVQGNGSYAIGTFDGEEFKQVGPRLQCDIGPNFYATQTWANTETGDGRRIQAAWMRGSTFPNMPFNQQISFPCQLTLRRTPAGVRLFREPIGEVKRLQASSKRWHSLKLAPGQSIQLASKGDLFRIRCSLAMQPGAQLEFNIRGEKLIVGPKSLSNGSAHRETIQAVRAIELLVDRGSIEAFINHGELSSTRFVLPEGQGITVMATGGAVELKSVEVNPLKSIWPP
ncbi:MAG: GH32 C-terminal domain-containing protein [Fimbriimonadaceae bacterium]